MTATYHAGVIITAEQGRVVACLIEKAETTPDSYPLTTNALVNACNQSTNRDPVVDFGAREVDAMVMELRQMQLARTVTGSGHRVGKHKHIVDETLGLDGHELAVLTILVLRGPQTLNEIVTRTERYTRGPAGDRAAVDAAIDRLANRSEPLARRLERGPGEREPRIDQVWIPTMNDADPGAAGGDRGETDGGDVSAVAPSPIASSPPPAPAPPTSLEPSAAATTPDLATRVAALEAELAVQSRRIDELLAQLGE